MTWSLYEKKQDDMKNIKGKFLSPLVFSNKKSQQDIVSEVLREIKNKTKVIFIRGVCGTGKSSIALNIAKETGKTSIVVPVKALQKQYEQDYTKNKYVLKNNNEKLKIEIITGRPNFICPYLKENPLPESKKSRNTTLDIFNFNSLSNPKEDPSCNNPFLPCKIEIKEKNSSYIRKYLEKNPKLKYSNIPIAKVRRFSIAPVCPYWSPLIPSEINIEIFDDAQKQKYIGLKNREYTIYNRKKGCGYYNQYHSYVDADVLIFNSLKYKIETAMNRKPATELEIIDECDEFLDSLSNQKNININRLNFALGSLFAENDKIQETITELESLTLKLMKESKFNLSEKSIIPLKQTKIFNLLIQEIFSED
jgi:hypothetical protein